MTEIHVLDNTTANMIAAGEVVERPASVVKELIENAIDAKSTKISIQIEGNGTELIKIIDNGSGMSKEDAQKAFLKHATSKIIKQEDLFAINTLGFRGEALAAIAAVSNIVIKTKEKASQTGWELKLDAGTISASEEAVSNNGTTIEVKNLFYNTPARLKFLKTEKTEISLITSLVEKLAISHTEISFTYSINSKEIFYTAGNGNLLDVIYYVFGKEFTDMVLKVDFKNTEGNPVIVKGFTGKPLLSKTNRSQQLFYVNKRVIKSKVLQNAFESAYRNCMLIGRYPACVLFVDIDFSDVDINVHPGKMEAKFSNEKLIYNTIINAIKNALNSDTGLDELIPVSPKPEKIILNRSEEIQKIIKENFNPKVEKNVVEKEQKITSYDDWTIIENKDHSIIKKEDSNLSGDFFSDISLNPSPTIKYENIILTKPDVIDNIEKSSAKSNASIEQTSKILEKNNFPSLKIIGEVFDSYIIVESGEDVLFIDKHALHERMNFEKLKTKNKVETQILLTPIVCSLGVIQNNVIEEQNDILQNLGFLIEDFGNKSIIVREIPEILASEDVEAFLSDFAESFLSLKKYNESEIMDKFLYDIACKASIKAGKKNDIKEIAVLIKEYINNNDKLKYCPHGRPIVFNFSKKTIEKQFKRII